MEKYKNNKNKRNSMMKRFSFLMLMFTVLFSGSAFALQQELIRYEFEENGGSVLVDSSGNANHAVNNGASWSSTTKKWGSYALNFDGNDYGVSIADTDFPEQFTLSLWIRPNFNNNNPKCMFCMKDGDEMHSFRYFPDTDELKYIYQNESGSIITTDVLDSSAFTNDVWYHLVFVVDTITNKVTYYRNSILTTLLDTTYPINTNDDPKAIYIGTDYTITDYYRGYQDEVRLFEGLLVSGQIGSLFSTNGVILETEEDYEDNVTQPSVIQLSNIINSTSPADNTSHYNPVQFTGLLNYEASCDLYVDNKIIESFYGMLAFTHQESLNVGEHTYFVYCEYQTGDTKYYDATGLRTVTVLENAPGTVDFTITGTDFDISTKNLFLTSPCLKEGMHIWSVSQPYNSQANPNGAYFRQLSNGFTSFTLPNGVHEFCLFHGSIDYMTYNKTANYYIGKAYNNINLGKYQIPNNLTTSYSITVENFDIYGKGNPKAWGQTWITIIGSLLAFAIGLGLAYIGVENKEPKMVLVGALLIMLSLGYQLGNLILGVLV